MSCDCLSSENYLYAVLREVFFEQLQQIFPAFCNLSFLDSDMSKYTGAVVLSTDRPQWWAVLLAASLKIPYIGNDPKDAVEGTLVICPETTKRVDGRDNLVLLRMTPPNLDEKKTPFGMPAKGTEHVLVQLADRHPDLFSLPHWLLKHLRFEEPCRELFCLTNYCEERAKSEWNNALLLRVAHELQTSEVCLEEFGAKYDEQQKVIADLLAATATLKLAALLPTDEHTAFIADALNAGVTVLAFNTPFHFSLMNDVVAAAHAQRGPVVFVHAQNPDKSWKVTVDSTDPDIAADKVARLLNPSGGGSAKRATANVDLARFTLE